MEEDTKFHSNFSHIFTQVEVNDKCISKINKYIEINDKCISILKALQEKKNRFENNDIIFLSVGNTVQICEIHHQIGFGYFDECLNSSASFRIL